MIRTWCECDRRTTPHVQPFCATRWAGASAERVGDIDGHLHVGQPVLSSIDYCVLPSAKPEKVDDVRMRRGPLCATRQADRWIGFERQETGENTEPSGTG